MLNILQNRFVRMKSIIMIFITIPPAFELRYFIIYFFFFLFLSPWKTIICTAFHMWVHFRNNPSDAIISHINRNIFFLLFFLSFLPFRFPNRKHRPCVCDLCAILIVFFSLHAFVFEWNSIHTYELAYYWNFMCLPHILKNKFP